MWAHRPRSMYVWHVALLADLIPPPSTYLPFLQSQIWMGAAMNGSWVEAIHIMFSWILYIWLPVDVTKRLTYLFPVNTTGDSVKGLLNFTCRRLQSTYCAFCTLKGASQLLSIKMVEISALWHCQSNLRICSSPYPIELNSDISLCGYQCIILKFKYLYLRILQMVAMSVNIQPL